MKEQEPELHVYSIPQIQLLKRFEGVLGDMKAYNLDPIKSPLRGELIQEEHSAIFHEAYDQGLIRELVIVKNHFDKHGKVE